MTRTIYSSLWISCVIILVTLSGTVTSMTDPCSPAEVEQCVNTADPLLRDPNYVFPSTRADISHVCRTWSRFLDCVRRYTDRCLTDEQRRNFTHAVEGPINSVHDLCNNTRYQEEYLVHAPCIKNVSIDENRCGQQYRYLVDQVSGSTTSTKQICCSHHKYRECILAITRRDCDLKTAGSNGLPASIFARQTLDKDLSFLLKQCENYIRTRVQTGLDKPNSGDCPGAGPSNFNPHPSSTVDHSPPSTNTQNSFQSHNTYTPYSSSSNPSAGTGYPSDLFGHPTNPNNNGPPYVTGGINYNSFSNGQNNNNNKPYVTSFRPSVDVHTSTRSTEQPWYPAISNDLDKPRQQGLSGNAAVAVANAYSLCIALFITFFMSVR